MIRIVRLMLGAVGLWLALGSGLGQIETAMADPDPVIVAVVSDGEEVFGVVTMKKLDRAIVQLSVDADVPVPNPQTPHYKRFADLALAQLLDAIDLRGEADLRNLVVPPAQVSREFSRVKKKSFESEAEFRSYLHSAKFTVSEIRDIVELQMLARRIEMQVIHGVRGVHAQFQALKEFGKEYVKRWRSRTTCDTQFATVRCSNGPSS